MAKAELKTTPTAVSVAGFLAGLPDQARAEEARQTDALFQRVTGLKPKMWGHSIIGYGSYDYKYDSGREGTMCRVGFSPRKAAMTLYAMGGLAESAEATALFAQLGKHTSSKGCIYIKKLSDVDLSVLERLIQLNWTGMNARYPI